MQQAPDRQEFDRLMISHLPVALAFATRLTGSNDEAEELVQSALLKAARAATSFRGESSFKTWFFRIILNSFHDSLAARDIEELPEDMAARMPSPLAEVVSKEACDRVTDAIAALPPRQREVLVLHTYEQMDHAGIAEMLGISEANVRKNLQLARDRLRILLMDYLKEPTRA